MQAIPTFYRGYLFRSRLEARWAVFFETLGIEWEYEPEAFSINGQGYLPDFRLHLNTPTFLGATYAEIKPLGVEGHEWYHSIFTDFQPLVFLEGPPCTATCYTIVWGDGGAALLFGEYFGDKAEYALSKSRSIRLDQFKTPRQSLYA